VEVAAEAQDFLAHVTAECQQKASDFAESAAARAAELKALAEAKRVLGALPRGGGGGGAGLPGARHGGVPAEGVGLRGERGGARRGAQGAGRGEARPREHHRRGRHAHLRLRPGALGQDRMCPGYPPLQSYDMHWVRI